MPIPQPEYIGRHQIAYVGPDEVVSGVAILFSSFVVLSQVQLESFVIESSHAAPVLGVDAGVVLCVLDHFYVADHIVDR